MLLDRTIVIFVSLLFVQLTLIFETNFKRIDFSNRTVFF